jgi:hypothetical protein
MIIYIYIRSDIGEFKVPSKYPRVFFNILCTKEGSFPKVSPNLKVVSLRAIAHRCVGPKLGEVHPSKPSQM